MTAVHRAIDNLALTLRGVDLRNITHHISLEVDGEYEECLIAHNTQGTGYNGYFIAKPEVQFKSVEKSGYDGILAYVNVHGGITYAKQLKDGCWIYGFDTVHHDSDQFPCNDLEWIKKELAIMIQSIHIAQKVEEEYMAKRGIINDMFSNATEERDFTPEESALFDGFFDNLNKVSSVGGSRAPNLAMMLNALSKCF